MGSHSASAGPGLRPEDAAWLGRAIDLAATGVPAGHGPFGALVVRWSDQTLLADGTNRVTVDIDPTAHAEVVAIRRACSGTGDFRLDGCVLYASCEPCPMCLGAALWSRVDRVVYAADRDEAAAAGFDDRAFHDLMGRPYRDWPLPVVRDPLAERLRPFRLWAESPGAVRY